MKIKLLAIALMCLSVTTWAVQENSEQITCHGVYLELDGGGKSFNSNNFMKSSFGKNWEKDWQLTSSVGTDGSLEFEILFTGNIGKKNKQYLDIVYNLRDSGIKIVEPICTYKNPATPLQQKGGIKNPNDTSCNRYTPGSTDPKYITCDTLWAVKNIKVIKKNSQGEWSDDWMERILAQKKSALLKKADLLDQKGKVAEADKIRFQVSHMKAYGKDVVVGSADTGYTNHPELISKIVSPENHTFGNNAYDSYGMFAPGHGTATASIIASPPLRQIDDEMNQGPLNYYVHGAAKESLIRPYRVATSSVVHVTFSHLTKAINSASAYNERHTSTEDYNKRVKVMSMSLGGAIPSKRLHKALKRALRNGIIPIAATANFIPEFVLKKFTVWPAYYRETLAVSATNIHNNPWPHSSKGRRVDISAPGEDVWLARSLVDSSGKEKFGVKKSSGTSYATALMAGVVANWLSFHGEPKMQEYGEHRLELFRYILKKVYMKGELTKIKCNQESWTCKYVDAKHYGLGIINMEAVLKEPLPTPTTLIKWTEDQRASGQQYFNLSHDAAEKFEHISALFSDFNDEKIGNGLAYIFKQRERNYSSFLEKHGQEVMFHLVNIPAFHRYYTLLLNSYERTKKKYPMKKYPNWLKKKIWKVKNSFYKRALRRRIKRLMKKYASKGLTKQISKWIW
jgi:hypothetical protein